MASKNKTALVTGATRGMGFAMTEKLATLGYKIIMLCRDEKSGKKSYEKLKSKGLDVVFGKADIENIKEIEKIYKKLSNEINCLDVLINSAAISIEPYEAKIENIDLAAYEKTMNINLRGTIWMCKNFIPLLKKSDDARIINFSSGLGQLSVPRMGPYPSYSISKTAVNAVTWCLAEELKDTNIKVFSVDPGWVKTDLGGPDAMLEISEGIDTPVWLATENSKKLKSGYFYKERKILGW